MTIDYICAIVAQLKRKYDEANPFRLAKAMGIIVDYASMGTSPESCKGFFLYQSRKKHITLNSDLPISTQRIILAHEIGHAVLHKKELTLLKAFHDFGLYDSTSRLEKEANLFAAEFLLDDDYVDEYINASYDMFSIARLLRVPPEMLDFKLRIMNDKGWNINIPLMSNSNFLKDITKNDRF